MAAKQRINNSRKPPKPPRRLEEEKVKPAAEVKRRAPRLVKPGLLERLYPTVALVGRPNVGKSSIFNALLEQEISITDARAGTTRDRVLHPLRIDDRACELLDTGGIGIVDKQQLESFVEDQIDAAVSTATILILVVDAKEGLTPMDRNIAERLRTLSRPVMVAANKTEGKEASMTVGEFSELGFEPVLPVSALHRQGIGELREALAEHLPEVPADEVEADWKGLPKLAIIGRRNVGKSSFVNALAKQDRTIVSDTPGTTRDSVDLLFEKDNRPFVLIDTAGLRRMKEPEGPVEFFSQVRTERAIKRADVVLFMFDAEEGVSTTDLKTADLIIEESRPVLLVVNKWDKAEDAATEDYVKYLEDQFKNMQHAPITFTSALNGTRCWQTVDVALDLYDQANVRVPTSQLNKALEAAERHHEPPRAKGRKPRLLYGVQVTVGPPTFVVYCRWSKYIDGRYQRYLQRFLAEALGLQEVPLRIFLRDAKH